MTSLGVMDLDEFRSFISDSGVDLWTWIDMAISVASADHETELRNRRDGIIQKLFASTCESCVKKSVKNESNTLQDHDMGYNEEQSEILEIKNLLEDPTQDEECLVDLLQRLVDMNTTFTALKETEIGRHVTKLRKHSSNEVRRLVKILVRKWKDTVDEWVRQNTPIEEEATDINVTKEESIDNGVKAVSCYSTPTKRREKDDGIGLGDQDYQESQHVMVAKKQRRPEPQVMNISKLKNSIVPNNGGTVPIKHW